MGSDGRKEAVLLGMAEYHRLMGKLEDLQDALALDRAERTSKKLIPYSSVQKRLKRAGKLKNAWRVRVRDHRVLYRIDDERQEVAILHIGHRRDVHR